MAVLRHNNIAIGSACGRCCHFWNAHNLTDCRDKKKRLGEIPSLLFCSHLQSILLDRDDASWTDDFSANQALCVEVSAASAEVCKAAISDSQAASWVSCLPSVDVCTCHRSEVARSDAD